ncbi:hypothetical protein GF325_01810 [Candidatus Bathyarchaeota archaeon]|nr:hypothetical protein [Candidatus Bathyarchaeota archaeon]
MKDLINSIHDLSKKKEDIINDTNYRKYLPLRHKILKGIYQLWFILIGTSILATVLYFKIDAASLEDFISSFVMFSFFYSLVVAAISLVLYFRRYTVPIAVTNEVKAKKVLSINNALKELKSELEKTFNKIMIEEFIHAGKFDPVNIRGSISLYVKTNFPQIQYIKDIFNEEILAYLEKEATVHIRKFSLALKGKIGSNAINITQISDEFNVAPSFVMQVLDFLMEKDEIQGEFSADGRLFIPSDFVPEPEEVPTTEQFTEEIPGIEGIGQASPTNYATSPEETQGSAVEAADASAGMAGGGQSIEGHELPQETAETPGVPAAYETHVNEIHGAQVQSITSKEQVIGIINQKEAAIEKLKDSYEQGAIGVDGYVNKLEELERDLRFLKVARRVREKVSDPTKACMQCHENIILGDETVECRNGHVFHKDCAFDYLQKFDRCPWCNIKIRDILPGN